MAVRMRKFAIIMTIESYDLLTYTRFMKILFVGTCLFWYA